VDTIAAEAYLRFDAESLISEAGNA
jgi:hypothetical protein